MITNNSLQQGQQNNNSVPPTPQNFTTIQIEEDNASSVANSVYTLANPSVAPSTLLFKGKEQELLDIANKSAPRRKSRKRSFVAKYNILPPSAARTPRPPRYSSSARKPTYQDQIHNDTACCASPCCCVASLHTALKIIIAVEFFRSGLTIMFGLFCAAFPANLIKVIALTGTYFLDEADVQNAESGVVNRMIFNLGAVYVLFGLATFLVTFFLIVGSKRKSISLCTSWSWGKILFILLFIAGFVASTFLQTNQAGLEESYSVNPGVAVFVLIAMCSIPIDIYFIYVVSIFITVLKLVDRKYTLLSKRIHDISERPPVKEDDDGEEAYTTEVVKRRKSERPKSYKLHPPAPLTSSLFRNELANPEDDDDTPKPRSVKPVGVKVRSLGGPAQFMALFDRQEQKNEALNRNLGNKMAVEQSSTLFGSEIAPGVPPSQMKKQENGANNFVIASLFREEITPTSFPPPGEKRKSKSAKKKSKDDGNEVAKSDLGENSKPELAPSSKRNDDDVVPDQARKKSSEPPENKKPPKPEISKIARSSAEHGRDKTKRKEESNRRHSSSSSSPSNDDDDDKVTKRSKRKSQNRRHSGKHGKKKDKKDDKSKIRVRKKKKSGGDGGKRSDSSSPSPEVKSSHRRRKSKK